jgi:hypothetical protein
MLETRARKSRKRGHEWAELGAARIPTPLVFSGKSLEDDEKTWVSSFRMAKEFVRV